MRDLTFILLILLVITSFADSYDDLYDRIQELHYPSSRRIIERSGTYEAMKLRAELNDAPLHIQARVKEELDRPFDHLMMTYDTPDGNFKIHYNSTGGHAASAEYIERMSDYLCHLWAKEIDTLGYLPPPSDHGEGGDDRYDIYVTNLGSYYGLTNPESDGDSSWNDAPSYIQVENDFAGFPPTLDPDGSPWGELKVTLAHEFFHAIQFAYNGDLDYAYDRWAMEIFAVWMEEQVFDAPDDYLSYIDGYFMAPWEGLTVSTFHSYESAVFGHFVHAKFGYDAVKEIFEESRYTAHLDLPINSVLETHGEGIEEEFADFTYWNWFTLDRDVDTLYEEAENWFYPRLSDSVFTYPNSGSAAEPLNYLSSAYYVFSNLSSSETAIKIDFNGDGYSEWRIRLIVYTDDGNFHIIRHEVPHSGDTYISVGDLDNVTDIIFIPSCVAGTVDRISETFDFSWAASYCDNVDENIILPSKLEASVYPNPFNSTCNISFENPIDSDSEFSLYSLDGKKLYSKSLTKGTRYITLYADNFESGSYLYSIANANDKNTEIMGKVSLIK